MCVCVWIRQRAVVCVKDVKQRMLYKGSCAISCLLRYEGWSVAIFLLWISRCPQLQVPDHMLADHSLSLFHFKRSYISHIRGGQFKKAKQNERMGRNWLTFECQSHCTILVRKDNYCAVAGKLNCWGTSFYNLVKGLLSYLSYSEFESRHLCFILGLYVGETCNMKSMFTHLIFLLLL